MKTPISWVWIILALVIFWPVGLVLLFKRLSDDRTAVFTCGKSLRTVYIIMFIIGGLLIVASRFGIGALLIIGGFVVLRIANNRNARAKRYRHYLDIILNHGERYISAIAFDVGVSNHVVLLELQQMLELGYFPGAWLDRANLEIVLPAAGMEHHAPMGHGHHAPFPETAPVHTTRIVPCPGCGASNTVTGATGQCEYCGSPIS